MGSGREASQQYFVANVGTVFKGHEELTYWARARGTGIAMWTGRNDAASQADSLERTMLLNSFL